MPQDRPNRQFFAETLLEREATNPGYLKKIVFTDESTFSVHGEVNRHNCRIWATENPHVTFEKPRVSPKTQVWCAVHYSQIVGPYFFEEPTVTGANYLECLRTFAIPQIRQIPNVDEFQQDGAPPHWSLNVRDYLDATFPDAWIGRGGPTAWPARSPDITPLDFFCGVTSRTESIRLLSMTWTTWNKRSVRLWRLWHLACWLPPGESFALGSSFWGRTTVIMSRCSFVEPLFLTLSKTVYAYEKIESCTLLSR